VTIFLILLAILFVIGGGVLWSRRHSKLLAMNQGTSTGVQIRKAAENIPIYGTFVKAAGVVGKPVNTVLRKWTDMQVGALKHIPIVGNYAAKPLEVTGSAVNKLNSWLGL